MNVLRQINKKERINNMRKSSMTVCKACGAEIASGAKSCPSCGAKNKKPIYRKWWFWVLIAVVVIIAVSGGDEESSIPPPTSTVQQGATESKEPVQESSEPEIEYIVCDITELFDALDANALKASDTYKHKYVEVTGHLGTIDSSGRYFGLTAGENNYDYIFHTFSCNIMNDEQKSFIMELTTDDQITVRGKITDVGEVLGYTLKIDSISK